LALGIYLELWIESSEGLHSKYAFVAPNKLPAQVSNSCSSAMRTYVFNADDFVQVDGMYLLGTHSLQKLLAMYA